LAATGAGTVDCTHHNLKRPMAVGDLQKGEKYIPYMFCIDISTLIRVYWQVYKYGLHFPLES